MDPADTVQSVLAPSERLLWVGRSRDDVPMESAVFVVLLGLLFTVAALVVLVPLMLLAPPLALPLAIMTLLAGAVAVSSPVWLRKMTARDVYAVTDGRVLIVRQRSASPQAVQSLGPRDLGEVKRIDGKRGRGTLLFEPEDAAGDEPTAVLGFVDIDGVDRVEALVRRVLRTDP